MNSTSLKRSYFLSDSDDCSEEIVQGNCNVTSGSGSTSYRGPTRKRRCGVIEKRRRDRINLSLDELKCLVTLALENSGSAKLEKAEILLMMVDYLTILHDNKVCNMNGTLCKIGHQYSYKIASEYLGLST
jgi:hypothetical protein